MVTNTTIITDIVIHTITVTRTAVGWG